MRRREPGSCWRMTVPWKKDCGVQTWSRWCEGRVKVARSTRSGRDTAEQLRQNVHLYTRALVGRDYFQPGTPLGERCWRLRWHDFQGSKVAAGEFIMLAANYRGIGVEKPGLGGTDAADW